MPAHDADRDREIALGDRTMPNLMASFPGAHVAAPGRIEKPARFAIERGHDLSGGSRDPVGGEMDLDLLAALDEPVHDGDLGRDCHGPREQ